MITTVLFDLDDTILDFKKAEATALSRTLSELGITPNDKTVSLYSEINDSQWKLFEKGMLTRAEVLHRRFEIFYERIGVIRSVDETKKKYETYLGIGHFFMPGAEDAIKALFGRYELAIVSNGTKRIQKTRIESSGIAKYFDKIFVSEDIGYNKPDKRFFDYCFANLSGRRETSMIVGDSLSSDILGGINAGIMTCHYNPKRKPADPLITPDFTIYDLRDLKGLISSINKGGENGYNV